VSSEHKEVDVEDARGFHWRRWTVIGCLAWIALVLIGGGSTIGLIFTPVIGPIGGWLVGGALYLVGSALAHSSE
jgi:hypothetical protein